MLKTSPWLLTLAFATGLVLPESVQAQAAPPTSAPATQNAPTTEGTVPAAKHATHHSSKHRNKHRTHHSSHKARRHHTPPATTAPKQSTQQK